MTIMMPCNNCRHAAACDLREAKRAALKEAGINLTVARFSCPIMKEEYQPGQPVKVGLPVWDEEGWDLEPSRFWFLGTVMRWKGRKLLIHLTTGDSVDGGATAEKPLVKQWPYLVEPLDEPMHPLCAVCDLPEGAVVKDWACECQPIGCAA